MLCRPHENLSRENLLTLCYWNLHGKNLVQFAFDGNLPRVLFDPFRRRHQVFDQCSRVHFRNLKRWIPTTEPTSGLWPLASGSRLSPSGPTVLSLSDGSLSAFFNL